mgnify:CR=1 FL=1
MEGNYRMSKPQIEEKEAENWWDVMRPMIKAMLEVDKKFLYIKDPITKMLEDIEVNQTRKIK